MSDSAQAELTEMLGDLEVLREVVRKTFASAFLSGVSVEQLATTGVSIEVSGYIELDAEETLAVIQCCDRPDLQAEEPDPS